MPTPTIFSYTIEDEAGNKATADLYVAYDAAAETVGALIASAAQYGGAIDAVTDGKIVEFNVKINALPDPGWKSAAAADSNVQKTLLENFHVTDSIYPWAFLVPAVKGSLVDVNGHPVIGSGAIKTLNDLITAGDTTTFPNNEFLLDLLAVRDAAVTFRKRKGARTKSKVKG